MGGCPWTLTCNTHCVNQDFKPHFKAYKALDNTNVDKMEPPIEENVVKKEKSLTARILSSADLKDMMSGSSKGLPIKVPTIPIKVITSNASQPTTIPGVIVAKPSATSPASNLILKGKTIPLVLEKQPTTHPPTHSHHTTHHRTHQTTHHTTHQTTHPPTTTQNS